jgi:hypothetical protein
MKASRETLILFGSKHDPEVQASINRAAITGRRVELKPTPGYDTNQGKCGKLCHCQHVCALHYDQTVRV